MTPTWIIRLVLSSMMEQAKSGRKKRSVTGKRVTGPDLPCVVVQERHPLLPSWSWCVKMSHVLLDGPLAHLHAELQKFSTNPLSTPEPIHCCHRLDQADGFCSDLRRVRSGLRPALPEQAKELAMPTQQCVWLNNNKGLLPCANQPGQEHEEHSIRLATSRSFRLPMKNEELLA